MGPHKKALNSTAMCIKAPLSLKDLFIKPTFHKAMAFKSKHLMTKATVRVMYQRLNDIFSKKPHNFHQNHNPFLYIVLKLYI